MVDRSKLDEVLAEIEATAQQRSAYELREQLEGPILAIKSAIEKIQKILAGSQGAEPVPLPYRDYYLQGGASPISTEPRTGSDQARVLTDIRRHPGSLGVEIVRRMQEVREVQERTIRTALHRLKVRGAIIQKGKRWYEAEHTAPSSEAQEGQKPLGL